jgi:3-dehydroquinate synthase
MVLRNFNTTRTTATDYIVGEDEIVLNELQRICETTPTVAIIDAGAHAAQKERIALLLTAAACTDTMLLEGGEKCKTPQELFSVLHFLAGAKLPKHGYILAIGGGAVLDVAAMAASLMRRGTPLILIPSTLLSQIDAAIGGKHGINFGKEKNLLGGFHHPDVVLCNPLLLDTLGQREIICGIAEAIKVLATSDAAAFERHFTKGPMDLSALVLDCVSSKLNLLQEDPFETSSRRLLNYGHAFAHLLEEESGFALAHGEAVLLGMLVENEISRAVTAAQNFQIDNLQGTIGSYLTPGCRHYWISFDRIRPKLSNVRQMRRGFLNLVCIQSAGDAIIIDDATDDILEAAWSRAELWVRRTPSRETGVPIHRTTSQNEQEIIVKQFEVDTAYASALQH